MLSAIHWVVAPGKVLPKAWHSGFSFSAIPHLFVCLIIVSPINMTDFLLDLGYSDGWS